MEINEEEKIEITKILKKKTFEFLNANKIELPIKVKNELEDVFDENTFTSDEEDVINLYFKEDLEDFLSDTKIVIQLNTQVKGGNSSGYILDKYSYHGILNTNNAIQEDIALYDGEEKVNQIYLREAITNNQLEDPDDFCIVLIEEQSFEMGEYRIIPRLYIYIPKSGEGIA